MTAVVCLVYVIYDLFTFLYPKKIFFKQNINNDYIKNKTLIVRGIIAHSHHD